MFFLIDARAGPMPVDRAFADLVRRSGKPAIVVANKSEGRAGEAGVLEAYALGLGEPVAISAEHGEGLADLYDALRAALPEATAQPAETSATASRRRRRGRSASPWSGGRTAGKSTLINRLIGEERLLTGPGGRHHARHHRGRSRLAWPGVPPARHRRHAAPAEGAGEARKAFGRRRAQRHPLRRGGGAADGCASSRSRSRTCASPIWSSARAARWSSASANGTWPSAQPARSASCARRPTSWLPQVKGVPLVGVSGLTGEGLDRLMQAVVDIHAVWNKRVPTAELNRWLGEAIAAHPPPAVSGRRIRLNYMTQAKSRPPSFVLFCTRADAVPDGLSALSRQRAARGLRPARHADPADAAREGQSVRRPRAAVRPAGAH